MVDTLAHDADSQRNLYLSLSAIHIGMNTAFRRWLFHSDEALESNLTVSKMIDFVYPSCHFLDCSFCTYGVLFKVLLEDMFRPVVWFDWNRSTVSTTSVSLNKHSFRSVLLMKPHCMPAEWKLMFSNEGHAIALIRNHLELNTGVEFEGPSMHWGFLFVNVHFHFFFF